MNPTDTETSTFPNEIPDTTRHRIAEIVRSTEQQTAATPIATLLETMGIPRRVFQTIQETNPNQAPEILDMVRKGMRSVLIRKRIFRMLSREEQSIILSKLADKYYRWEVQRTDIQGIVDAPHGCRLTPEEEALCRLTGFPGIDAFTGDIALLIPNFMIPTVSRLELDVNASTSTQIARGGFITRRPNLDAILGQRYRILGTLQVCENCTEDEQAMHPFLYIALHGKRDGRGADIEIAARETRGQAPLDPRLAFWLAEKLRQKIQERRILNAKYEIATVNVATLFGEHYSGTPALRGLRNGDGLLGFKGFGQMFQAVQLEVSRHLRDGYREELAEILQYILEDFTLSFPNEAAFEEEMQKYQKDYEFKMEEENPTFWAKGKVHFDPNIDPGTIELSGEARETAGVDVDDTLLIEGLPAVVTVVKRKKKSIQDTRNLIGLNPQHESRIGPVLHFRKIEPPNSVAKE